MYVCIRTSHTVRVVMNENYFQGELHVYLGLVVSRDRFVLALDREEVEPSVLLCWLLVTIPWELRFE